MQASRATNGTRATDNVSSIVSYLAGAGAGAGAVPVAVAGPATQANIPAFPESLLVRGCRVTISVGARGPRRGADA